jgi:hypothetical protein
VGYSITADIYGNVFVIGYTKSTNFPLQNGGGYFDATCGGCPSYSDVFILKFNSSGQRLWATYYGGSLNDIGHSIGVDGQGNVFITGHTDSPDFPTQMNGNAYLQSFAGMWDAFILKFNNSGALLWATYYGGSGSECIQYVEGGCSITVDAQGSVFLTGLTSSTDFPLQNLSGAYYDGSLDGSNDAYIVKFDNLGVRQWATYYGGNNQECAFDICAIRTDLQGNVFITGSTGSSNFPLKDAGGGAYYDSTRDGGYDIFISKLSSASSFNTEKPTYFYHKNEIALNLNYPSDIILVKIYSIDGRLIISKLYQNPKLIKLNIKNLKKGLYVLKVNSANKEILTYKFIKD